VPQRTQALVGVCKPKEMCLRHEAGERIKGVDIRGCVCHMQYMC